MTARIALATAAEFPDLDEDAPALLAALTEQDIQGEPAVWTDPRVDWSAYDLVVVRSTWDYQDRHAEFLDWARRVAAVTTLKNSAEVLAWNTDKTYLRTLQKAGLPVVPTDWLDPGDAFVVPEVGEYVVKPAVSAGSRDTNRYRAGDHDEQRRRARQRPARGGTHGDGAALPRAGRHPRRDRACSSSVASSAMRCARGRCSPRRWSW